MMKKTLIALALIGAASAAQADATVTTEGFTNVSTLAGQGWMFSNTSTPAGSTGWFQGDVGVFKAQAGADDSYIAANYHNAAAGGTIDNLMLTQAFSTANYGSVSFYARADAYPGTSDSLTFGMVDAAGNFINPQTFTVPTDDWQMYSVYFAGTGAATTARFGIRYSGLADTSNYVGVDTLAIDLPEPSTPLMLSVGALGLIVARRRKQS